VFSRFIVIGSGAIGCYIGGCLLAAGSEVHFVGRQHSVDSLKTDGLKISDLDGFESDIDRSQLHVYSSLAGLEPSILRAEGNSPPIVLVCVKSGATNAVGQDIARFCSPGSTVISLQNGIDNVARLKALAPRMKVLAGMVPYNVVMKSPSYCHRATAGSLLIEQFPESHSLSALLNNGGIAAQFRADMVAVQWGKLLLNLNNPINALSDIPLKKQLEDRDYRRVLACLQIEALRILAFAGITPAKVGKVSPELLPKLLSLPNWVFKRIASSMLKMDTSARSSMWVDLKAGKETEIDDLCGAVVRLAQSHGQVAIVNHVMIKLIKDYRANQVWNGKKLLREITGSKLPQQL
jgi:2-dehydropantoate 2-reductase